MNRRHYLVALDQCIADRPEQVIDLPTSQCMFVNKTGDGASTIDAATDLENQKENLVRL